MADFTINIQEGDTSCDSGMDVVFIFDYTGSMSSQIEAAKTGVSNIISTIITEASPNDYRLGLVIADEYASGTTSNYSENSDYIALPSNQKIINNTTSGKFQWITAMNILSTNNQVEFTDKLNLLNNSSTGFPLGNGSGTPEPTDLALSKVIENNLVGTFRSNTAKYVILITDTSPGGDDDINDNDDIVELKRLKEICITQGIKIIILGAGVYHEPITGVFPWKELATDTGGSFNASFDATTIQSEITNNCSE